MKLKPVFLALSILGLVTGPALAASGAKAAAPKVIKAQEVIDQNSATSSTCDLGWTDRIKLGGLLNVDALWGSHNPIGSFTKTSGSTDINLNNANLFVDGKVNEWVNAHVNVAYFGQRHNLMFFPDLTNGTQVGTTSGTLVNLYGEKDFTMDEAYVTVADFAKSPLYLRVGKQRVAFGDYSPYPLVLSPTQAMTETDVTAVAGGFVTDSGFYGNIFAFNGATVEQTTFNDESNDSYLDKVPNIRNVGAKLGYFGTLPALGMADTHYNADVSYIRNIYDTTLGQMFVSEGLFLSPMVTVGVKPVGGLAAHFDASYKAFDFFANYATALGDLVQPEWTSLNLGDSHMWAADLNAGYSFQTANHDSKVGLSYQWTGNGEFSAFSPTAALVSVPKNRWMVDYSVNVLRNTDLALAFVHDKSYDFYTVDASDATDCRESNSAIMRLSVQF